MDASGSVTTLHAFSGPDGEGLAAPLIQASDGNLYGTTPGGTAANFGTIFKIDMAGNFVTLHFFNVTDGSGPGSLIQGSDGYLYGSTSAGGASIEGTIFRADTLGNVTTLHSFSGLDGAGPIAAPVQGTDGYFYGTTYRGGTNPNCDCGTVFKVDSAGNFQSLHSFEGADGLNPHAGLIEGTDGYFYGTTESGGGAFGEVFRVDSAGALTLFHPFLNMDGATPHASLLQATDGSFYGTTLWGGIAGLGTIFRIDPAGSESLLLSFAGSDGANPVSALIQAIDGNFYGATQGGGANNLGTVFRCDVGGNLTTLYSFAGTDGSGPNGLLQLSDGFFYGTTSGGGANNAGTVFRIDGAGNLTTLHSFVSSEGSFPLGALTQGTDGYLYGAADNGGAFLWGSLFKVDTLGNLTTLWSFTETGDGALPTGGLVLASDGNFYGTTSAAGVGGYGTVFVMDSAGNLTTIHSFSGPDGAVPQGIVQAGDGDFYGATNFGGANNAGTVFRIDATHNLTTLHAFSYTDGAGPSAAPIQGGDGYLYGVTGGGGLGSGVAFKIDRCTSRPSPVITAPHCVPPSTSGLIASTLNVPGDTYTWTLAGGTIDSGQGTYEISFTSGTVAQLMQLSVVETDGLGCANSATDNMQTDFADVPSTNPFHSFVCAVARAGITGGCGAGDFCPSENVSRSQMSVFLLRGEHGPGYLPPACTTPIFNDVPCSDPFSGWVDQIYNEGITGGCGANPPMFCPASDVTRSQMAVFLLSAEHGGGYTPPACMGIFTDVPCPGPFTDWIEEFYNEGITGGCSNNPAQFCPANPVTRGQMAAFLVTAFRLP
jgi:uncharacterized repeat protein (TIGR03803 family)